MTDDRDDGDDDLQLKQLRSVWLSMRDDDDEPSDRGMAALMAAAREQAEKMTPKPSLFARFVEQFRRPPVLALATVVVLVGGAVAITQRAKLDEPLESERISANTAAPAAPRADEANGGTAAAPPADEAEGGTGATIGSEQADPAESAKDSSVAVEKPKRRAQRDSARSSAGPAAEAPPPPPPPPPPPAAAPSSPAAAPGGSGSTRAAPKPSTPVAAPKPEPVEAKPESRPAPDAAAKPKADKAADTFLATDSELAEDSAPPTLATLLAQCHAAAARSDCGAVRRLAATIATRDRTEHAKLIKRADVARCLAAQ